MKSTFTRSAFRAKSGPIVTQSLDSFRKKRDFMAMGKELLKVPIEDKIVVDLFAGAGGHSVAIEAAIGKSPDVALNHNPDAMSAHERNHPKTHHVISDIREADPIVATGGRMVGYIHLSPDCTHFSQASGGQPRKKNIRGLSWMGTRWAAKTRPDLITLECVTQITQWGPLIAKRDKATGRVIKLVEEKVARKRGRSKVVTKQVVAAKGEVVPVQQQFLIPDPKRIGQTWKRFLSTLESLGYECQPFIVNAADHGACTSRIRLFLVARCDGLPIQPPVQTHFKNPKPGQRKWRAAAENIDFTLECPSIFTRKKPLAESSLRRVAKGVTRYAVQAAEPFIVKVTRTHDGHGTSVTSPLGTITTAKGGELMLANPVIVPATHQGDTRVYDTNGVLPTITGANRGELMLSAPLLAKFRFDSHGHRIDEPMPTITSGGAYQREAGAAHALGVVSPRLVQMDPGTPESPPADEFSMAAAGLIQVGYGERKGQAPRVASHQEPMGTAVGVVKHAHCVAFLAQHNTMPNGFVHAGHSLNDPSSSITGKGCQQNVVAANLLQLNNNCDGRNPLDPLKTIRANGEHHGVVESEMVPINQYGLTDENLEKALQVASFIAQYSTDAQVTAAFASMNIAEKLALVTVIVAGIPHVIIDIGVRMITPREAYLSQGFPTNYVITHGHDGRVFSKAKQIKMCGNSVSPYAAFAVIKANYPASNPNAVAEYRQAA